MAAGQTEKTTTTDAQTKPIAPRKGSIFKKLLLAGAVLIVAFLAVVAMQSPEMHVVRSAKISASPETVFEQVNDFHKWEAWSPWAKIDPDCKNTFEGASSGEGAIFRWSGNSEVGEGSMTVTESRPGELVAIKLDFIRPFAGTSDVQFTFKPEGDQTNVTWSMSSEKNFVAKAIGLFMDCEKMCGDQFNQGLVSMKSVVEAENK